MLNIEVKFSEWVDSFNDGFEALFNEGNILKLSEIKCHLLVQKMNQKILHWVTGTPL